jgi:hypothetical protein
MPLAPIDRTNLPSNATGVDMGTASPARNLRLEHRSNSASVAPFSSIASHLRLCQSSEQNVFHRLSSLIFVE